MSERIAAKPLSIMGRNELLAELKERRARDAEQAAQYDAVVELMEQPPAPTSALVQLMSRPADTDARYIFCAKVDEYGGNEPAIDTSSFSLMKVTLLAAHPDEDGVEGAEVRLEDGTTTWYERRFLLTAEQLSTLQLRMRLP